MVKEFYWYEIVVASVMCSLIVILGGIFVPQTVSSTLFILVICSLFYVWKQELPFGTELLAIFTVLLVGLLLVSATLGIAYFINDSFFIDWNSSLGGFMDNILEGNDKREVPGHKKYFN